MEYTVTSFSESRDGKRGQITVTVGEGRNRRSFTRHLQRQGGAWVGLNIDPRAIPLNELYESELAEAKSELSAAKTALKNLRESLAKEERLTEKEKLRIYSVADGAEVIKEQLRENITATELEVYAAEAIVDDAEAKLDIVRRELPLMMEFNVPYRK